MQSSNQKPVGLQRGWITEFEFLWDRRWATLSTQNIGPPAQSGWRLQAPQGDAGGKVEAALKAKHGSIEGRMMFGPYWILWDLIYGGR